MTTLTGTSSDNLLVGTGTSDTISGGGGDDLILAGGGSDTVSGGSGDDLILAGSGCDTVSGGTGNDVILAGSGDDVVSGGSGSDFIDGGKGDDVLSGGSGSDIIDGGKGDDFIDGGSGDDRLFGGAGSDLVYGGSGSDWISGGSGDDLLLGGSGSDTIFGGDGNDVVEGGSGNDTIYGEAGHDLLLGGSGDDLVDGGTGRDIVVGGSGHDNLSGGVDDDVMDGGGGDDVVDGGAGNDTLIGGAGVDWLQGGSGSDRFVFQDASDSPVACNWDRIIDFQQGKDKIDLSVFREADDLVWNGDHGARKFGVWFDRSDARTVVHADTNGDGVEDLRIELKNTCDLNLTVNDFIGVSEGNSSPVAMADTNAGDPVTEAGVNPDNTPFVGDASATGNVLTNDTDVDTGDTKSVTTTGTFTGTYGTLTLNTDGSYSYALDNSDTDTNALAQGASVTDVFAYTMADANGATSSSMLTIGITGTDDAPDAVDDVADLIPGIALGGNVLTDKDALGRFDSDVDAGDTLHVTFLKNVTFPLDGKVVEDGSDIIVQGEFGFILMTDDDGQWSYVFDPLKAPTANDTDVFEYTIADQHGATDLAQLVINVPGTGSSSASLTSSVPAPTVTGGTGGGSGSAAGTGGNTAPVAMPDLVYASASGNAGNVLANDSDADLGDSLIVTEVNGNLVDGGDVYLYGTYGNLMISFDGVWSYGVNAAGTDALAQGADVVDVFDYTIADASGATASSALTFDFLL